MTRAPPLAHGGMLAIIGAKKSEKKKKMPHKTAVRPVRDPASTPIPLSRKEVTGESPNKEPNILANASAAKACLLFGKFPFSSTYPMDETSAKRVP